MLYTINRLIRPTNVRAFNDRHKAASFYIIMSSKYEYVSIKKINFKHVVKYK